MDIGYALKVPEIFTGSSNGWPLVEVGRYIKVYISERYLIKEYE